MPRIDIEDYPAIKKWLDSHWEKIEKRADQGNTPYNLRNCAYMDEFSKQKIVWKRIGSILRFSFDDNGYLGLDSTCILTGKKIKYLTAYLNSNIARLLLQDSPRTGTGDLIISVQALEPLLVPILNKSDEKHIVKLMNEVISAISDKQPIDKIDSILNKVFYKVLMLNKQEINFINNNDL